MKAYIQTNRKGLPFNETVFNAYDGFDEMGVETVFFNQHETLKEAERCGVVVGGLGMTKWHPEQSECH